MGDVHRDRSIDGVSCSAISMEKKFTFLLSSIFLDKNCVISKTFFLSSFVGIFVTIVTQELMPRTYFRVTYLRYAY